MPKCACQLFRLAPYLNCLLEMIIIDIQILSTANANISIIIGKTTANPIVSVICIYESAIEFYGNNWR